MSPRPAGSQHEFLAHEGARLHAADAAPEERDGAGEPELIAGHHAPAELGAVHGGQVTDRAPIGLALAHGQAHGGGLRQRLDDEDTGHDGLVREVTNEVGLVVRDVLDALEGVA